MVALDPGKQSHAKSRKARADPDSPDGAVDERALNRARTAEKRIARLLEQHVLSATLTLTLTLISPWRLLEQHVLSADALATASGRRAAGSRCGTGARATGRR